MDRSDAHDPRRSRRRAARAARPSAADDAWQIELQTERSGLHPDRPHGFAYRYRRLRVERHGRRCAVREFSLRLEYDHDLILVTKPSRLVRQRGRSLPLDEAERLWAHVDHLRRRLRDSYPCLDDVDPADLDDAVGPSGEPVAVALGEEGPACLTIRAGRPGAPLQRVLIDRYRTSPGDAVALGRRAPLTALVAALEPGLREAHAFNYRRSQALPDLLAELAGLKATAFLNLRQVERRCLEALGCLRHPDAVPVLTGELFGSDTEVRLQALDALASIGCDSAANEVELLQYDDHPSVRERARAVLGVLQGRARC